MWPLFKEDEDISVSFLKQRSSCWIQQPRLIQPSSPKHFFTTLTQPGQLFVNGKSDVSDSVETRTGTIGHDWNDYNYEKQA